MREGGREGAGERERERERIIYIYIHMFLVEVHGGQAIRGSCEVSAFPLRSGNSRVTLQPEPWAF